MLSVHTSTLCRKLNHKSCTRQIEIRQKIKKYITRSTSCILSQNSGLIIYLFPDFFNTRVNHKVYLIAIAIKRNECYYEQLLYVVLYICTLYQIYIYMCKTEFMNLINFPTFESNLLKNWCFK